MGCRGDMSVNNVFAMSRRSAVKRPYPANVAASLTGNSEPHIHSDSDGDEFIDVETIGSGQVRAAHFVDASATESVSPQARTAVRRRRLAPRLRRSATKFRSCVGAVSFIPRVTTPRVTLVGRGRTESLSSTFLNVDNSQRHAEQVASTASSKRVPILAKEGIGTYVVPKLPLEEMTMSTRALRAIQEDHKTQCDENQLERIPISEFSSDKEVKAAVLLTSAEPSTSSDPLNAASGKKSDSTSPIGCAHFHCPVTFSSIDELVSHLVVFHCQHQFSPRKMTFMSTEKYEAWKTTYEKTHDAKMLTDDTCEQSEGLLRMRYYCEHCDNKSHQPEERRSRTKDKFTSITAICPAHFTASINQEKNTVVVVGCFAHLGHAKKTVQPQVITSGSPTQKSRQKPVQAKCKHCGKWFMSRVVMNRHVKEQHSDPNIIKGTTIECGDPHCDVVCDRMSTLCEHVAQEHGREDLIIEEFKFSDIAKFKEWKKELETGTVSKFVLSSSRTRASGVIQSYFLCHLSGYANRSRHSTPPVGRLRSTKKLGRYCTAFMNTKEFKDGSVLVQCCLGHFGHGFDVRRLPLPDKVKDEVTELLLKGVTTQEVYETVRKRYSQTERGYYLQRYEIRNIADKLRKQGLLSHKDREKQTNTLEHLSSSQMPANSSLSMEKPHAPTPNVRFQSLRIQSERAQIFRSVWKMDDLSDPKLERSLEQSHYAHPGRSTSALEVASSGDRLRDVSPPIIGTSGYMEFHGAMVYDDMIVADENDVDSLTYFDETQHGESLLDAIHSERDPTECSSTIVTAKVTPLLMEPQPTGNVSFDESMIDINRRIHVLQDQRRRTHDANKLNLLLTQIRDLQGQLVRNVPQTTGFIQTTEQEFDGEEDDEEVQYDPIEGDDAVCFEVEVESSEAPSKGRPSISMERYKDLGFETDPYEEVVTAGYELL
ncbi:hypothetical protein RB195_015631 [Necator americanus]|uniref:C2H2-type domain-containing protein n=1 Tax=Necator americanus TaxID=51031 RepID=A0ABR1E5K3_NECAM